MNSERKALVKTMDLATAVAKYVGDGCSLSLGGAIAREGVAVAREIVRQKKKDLTLMGAAKTSAGEILVGAGCLKRIEIAYFWIGVVGQGYNYRRALEQGIPLRPEVADYSMFSASLRFLAGSMGIGFLPTRSLLSSDILAQNPDLKTIIDPYSGEELAVVPAANPDVAFVHVQRCDPSGNAVIMGNLWNDPTLARAAKRTVITCEEIIDEGEIRKNPNLTAIPRYCVDAVVRLPFGAHPEPVDGYYWMDQPFRRDFTLRSQSREGFLEWLQEWVWDCPDHQAYLDKLGERRIQALGIIEKRFRQGMAR